jgi:hypothetical protein
MDTFCIRVFSNQREVINLYGHHLERIRELAKSFTDKYQVDYAEIREGEKEGALIEAVHSLARVQAK